MKLTNLLHPTTFCTVAVLSLAASDQHDAWPQWRGPNLDGTVKASGLPVEWSDTKNVVWKTKLPWWSGSTPVIWGDRIFLTSPAELPGGGEALAPEPAAPPPFSRRGGRPGGGGGPERSARMAPGGEVLLLLCVDRGSGEIIWTREIDEGNALHRKHNNSSPSPVTDGAHVWVLTGNGALSCYDLNGERKWARHLQDDYGRFGLNHGYGASPLLYEDRLIVPVLHGMRTDDPSYLLAVDKATGKTIWRTERPTNAPRESPDAYTTPQLLTHGGRIEIVLNGGDLVTGHDMRSGRELWRADVLNPRKAPNYRIIPSSLIVGDIIIAPTRQDPMTALRAGGNGDVSQSHVIWQFPYGPDVPTPVSDGTHLWTIAGDRSMLSCLEVRTGRVLYERERLPAGTYSSSPVLAEDRIYLVNENATTVVVSATPEFEVLATNSLDDSYTLASPVIVGNRIYIRTGEHLYCLADLEAATLGAR
jgi:outer membrane protein assembly factor BamB